MFRIGNGYDVHKFAEDRKLILGGVEIPYEKGLLGHSDADVLTHAIMDAILGALAFGDIGYHFPDTDPRYKGISSILLLKKVIKIREHIYPNVLKELIFYYVVHGHIYWSIFICCWNYT